MVKHENRKFHKPSDAVSVIERNNGIVNMQDKAISVHQPGLKVLSAVDFLVNHCGYQAKYETL